MIFVLSSRTLHTVIAFVSGAQTFALPIYRVLTFCRYRKREATRLIMNSKKVIRSVLLLGVVLAESADRVLDYMVHDHTHFSGSTIVNAGRSGNNTRNLLARLDKDCLALRPSLVILMVGTNDMNSRNHVPLAEYEVKIGRAHV